MVRMMSNRQVNRPGSRSNHSLKAGIPIMYSKLHLPIIGCLALLLLCSGCSFSKDPQSYMRTPRLPENQASLVQMIQQALPAGASLIRPQVSRDLGSIYMKDLDGDGMPEAVAFYQTSDKEARIHGMLWQRSGDVWNQASDFQGEGYELATLLFEDVTGDGKLDIIAGYSSGARLNKGLVIYRYDRQKLESVYEAPYAEMAIDDLNQDGVKDITLVSLDRGTASQAVTLQFDKTFKPLGSVPLDPSINGYESLQAGWIAEGKRGLILDYAVGAHSSSTQVLLFQQGELAKALSDRNIPFKPRSAFSGDLNHDGIMEIGIDYVPKGSEDEPHVSMPYITAYYRWNGTDGLDPHPLYERYIDYGNSFYFDIPAEWKDQFKVERFTEDTQPGLRFISQTTGQTLIEWKNAPAPSEPGEALPEDWKEIGRTAKTVTLVHITADNHVSAGWFHPMSELEKQEEPHEQSTHIGG